MEMGQRIKMAKFIKDNFTILLVSMLVGLLCWLSEKVIEDSVRLGILELKINKLTDEFLIIKDNEFSRRNK